MPVIDPQSKPVTLVGVLLLVLGIAAFILPIPHREQHRIEIGDAKIGVQTENSEKLPPRGRNCASHRRCRRLGSWGT
jgi:hypothetical protein